MHRYIDLYFLIDHETIAINIWIGAFSTHSSITKATIPDLECNMSGYVKAFQHVLQHIYQ